MCRNGSAFPVGLPKFTRGSRLRLFALDPYDAALAKIERNSARGRDDVRHLGRVVPFDLEILKQRYTGGSACLPRRS